MLPLLLCVLLPSADEKPITTDPGQIGKLLRDWQRMGTAGGNEGDWYDNRDGEHSPLDLKPWPQLKKVKYTPEDIKARRHWALQPRVLPHVTFGNSSTSAPPTMGGSNPRMYYTSATGLALLQQHYRKSNVYIYPEHRDHDPGHNGLGDGFGDMYPTNTPYLIISQGSSGSDQPFMRAIPFTLAAFRPEVKKLLVEKGLLMPTLQRVFRASNKTITRPEDYFTGKAHPTVFEGSKVDALRMVKMAHEITKGTIPPLVQLKVTEEDEAKNGVDFYELPFRTEKLADTPAVIARVWRGRAGQRRMLVSAKDSIDANGKELSFKWVVLRGDEKRITITLKGKGEAEIVIKHHERRPVSPGSVLESSRVDIGVFADNGVAVSAPAFITWHSLDSEVREGRRIIHGAGVNVVAVTDWVKALTALSKDGPAPKALEVTAAEREALVTVAKEAGMLRNDVDEVTKGEAAKRKAVLDAREMKAKAEARLKKAQAAKNDEDVAQEMKAIQKADKERILLELDLKVQELAVKKAREALDKALDGKTDALKGGARPFVQARLDKAMKGTPLDGRLKDLPANGRVAAIRKKVSALGDSPKTGFLGELNGAILADLVLPGAVRSTFHLNYIDPRIATARDWADTFDEDGGWTRRQVGKADARFTPEGWAVTEEDKEKRPLKARTVVYKQGRPVKGMWINTHPLSWVPGPELITFAYEDGKRVIKSREKVEEPAP